MFDDLIKWWKMVYQTYLAGDLKKPIYYYLTACIVVVGGMYIYIYYSGFIALAIILSALVGVYPPDGIPPISILGAVGIVFILRYGLMGAVDNLAKKPAQFEERIVTIGDKVNELHKLAFGEVEEEGEENDKGKGTKRQRR
jgi:hypothetical protein